MKVSQVEEIPTDKFLVTIHDNKNNYPGQFIIGKLFYNKIKDYISLRPNDQEFSDRFFIHYTKGRCTRQPMGRHKIAEVPKNIATYLNLDDAPRFTGHCFRRTSATLLSESGATMQQIKQLGRWRSDIIAQGYIEHSIRNKELIYNGIIHESNGINIQPHIQPIPSTSAAVISHTYNNTIHNSNTDNVLNSDLNLADIEFSDEFIPDNTS